MATITTPAAGVSPYPAAAAAPTVLRAAADGTTVLSTAAAAAATVSELAAANANTLVVVNGQAALNSLITTSQPGVFDGANVTINLEEQNFNTTNQVTSTINSPSGSTGEIQYNSGANSFASDAYFTYTNSNVVTPGIRTNNYLYGNGAPFIGGGNAAIGNFVFSGDIMSISDANQVMSITGNGTGNVNVTANSNVWVFNNVGNLILPSNSSGINYANGSPYGGGNYSNSNVSSFLAAFGSNVVSTTGNITGGNLTTTGTANVASLAVTGSATVQGSISIFTTSTSLSAAGNIIGSNFIVSGVLVSTNTVSAIGNITGNYFIGNGSQLTGVVSSYGNANVVANLAALGSNPVSTTGNVTGGNLSGTSITGTLTTGTQSAITSVGTLTNISTSGNANVTGNVNSARVSATGNITAGNILTGGLISVAGNITAGNLDAVNLVINSITSDDSTFVTIEDGVNVNGEISATGNITGNYFIGNGSQLTGIIANTGNVTFSSEIVIGTGTSNLISGLYLAPSSSSANANMYLRVRGNIVDEPTHIHFDTGNNAYYNQFIGDDNKYIQLANTGNIVINSNDVAGNAAQWNFGTTGVLTLPKGGATIRDTVGNAVAFGRDAAATGPQGNAAVAIGQQAGDTSQGASAVAIGYQAGLNTQGINAVAIGNSAGNNNQGGGTVAIGYHSGKIQQGTGAVAVGADAGANVQGDYTVAVGLQAGNSLQGDYAVAVGFNAGYDTQGVNSVAIGSYAGQSAQGNNSIIINATGAGLNAATANTFTVAPVRNDVANIAEIVFYNATSKEITYGNTISVAGNITGNYFIGNGSQLTSVAVPSQTILPTIQSITAVARPAGLFGGGQGGANVTVANNIPVTEYGVIITAGTTSETYKTGALGSIPGTVALTFTTGLNSTQYTLFAYVTSNAGTYYSDAVTGTSGICLLAGTQIALSDGTHKAIEHITYTDKLLSWDFDRGCYAETTAMWIKRSETGSQYNLLTFSDGTTLRTFDQHRIFNKQAGAFTYPMTAATPVGTVTVNEHGQEITLTRKQVIRDTIEYYNVITNYHMNLFSDSVLTSCRFNNIYPIVDMKFAKDNRTLRTRAEFENVPDRFFHGLRLAEQIADIETVEWYVNRLLSTEVSTQPELAF